MAQVESNTASLIDNDIAEASHDQTTLQPALVPQLAWAPKRTDEASDEKAKQEDWHAVDWMSGLSLAGANISSFVPSTRPPKPWHGKHGPPLHLRPWATGANATHVHRRRRDFKIVKTLRKITSAPSDQDPSFRGLPTNVPRGPREGAGGIDQSRHAPQPGDEIMADIEDRRDYRRGGGGGRHAGQKRRFREDDDHDRRPQRRFERPEYPSQRARRLVWGIADNSMRNAEEDVADIAKLLADNAEDEIFRDRVSNDIVQIIQEQPFKIPFVAAIVLYTNQQKPEFVQMIITKTTTRIQAVLEAGEWRTFKLLLRFLGCMQTMFEGDGCFPLLDELFNRAADLQSASSEDTLGLELVKIILLTMPYVLASTGGSAFAQQASELLSKTDIIASAPRDVENLVQPFMALEDGQSRQAPSVIGLLQTQMQGEADNGWPLAFIPRLFKPAAPADGEEATTPQKLQFPAINIPQTITSGTKKLFPELYFSLYADQDIETVPPTSNVAASLIRDTLVDTIGILDFNRGAVAKYLIDLDCYWAPETFIRRATPFDKIKDIPEGKPTWKPEDLAVDAVFSQMLQLPAPEHKIVYYHSVITETTKVAAGAIAPCLGRAIRYLYSNMDSIDVELSHRFMDWFSHHLSNYDFQWKWKEWVEDVKLDPLYPQKAYILGALDKEVRLSFAKRIRQTLPEEYQRLIPASQDNDIPEFKYNNERELPEQIAVLRITPKAIDSQSCDKVTPHSAEAKQLVRMLRKKAPDSEVEGVLTRIASASQNPDASSDPNTNPSPADDDPAALLPAIDAFATTICYIGSKSLSHVLSHIERQKDRLTTLSASGPEAQKQLISSVVAYWRDVQPGVAVNIVDKLLNYTILAPSAVVEWALDARRVAGGRTLAMAWVYEMVERTVRKVTGRVRQILAARLQRGLPAAQTDVLDAALVEEAAAMRALFAAIDDALGPVAEGTSDAILEGDADMEGVDVSEEDRRLCALWGAKWRRVFARKLGVEEMVLADMGRSFPPPAEEDPTLLDAANGDGGDDDDDAAVNGEVGDGVNGNGNGEAHADVDVDLDIS